MTSFAPCGIGFVGVQLPCADASPDNSALAIAATTHALVSMSPPSGRYCAGASPARWFFALSLESEAQRLGPWTKSRKAPHPLRFFVLEDVTVSYLFTNSTPLAQR